MIGSVQYLDQIQVHLEEQGFAVIRKADSQSKLSREDGLVRLKSNTESNLGWRIILETDGPSFDKKIMADSVNSVAPMCTLLPEEFKAGILKEAVDFQAQISTLPAQTPEVDKTKPTIKLTSFEGSKGLSAQHVFVVGVHENELPKDSNAIKDLEICKFLVSLTRTRKQCHVLTTFRFSGVSRRPSIFLSWIPAAIKRVQKVDKNFWAKAGT